MSTLRKKRGLSQRKVASDLQISQALLSHYENGAREPGLEFVCRACEYYGVSADYLLTGRLEAPRDTAAAEAAFRRCMEALLEKTDRHSGFSRQELAVLMAAVLTEG